jgi:hypothetical protein
MKKLVIASILGTLGVTMSSYGQGQVNFANYNFGATSLNSPVTFAVSGQEGGAPVTAGWGVGSTFTAQLLYEFGTMTSYAVLDSGSAGAGSQYPAQFAFGAAGNGAVSTTTFAGYFLGPTVTLPTAGAINLEIQVFDGSSVAAASWTGLSAPISLASLPSGTALPLDLAFGAFTVSPVPEPTTLALAGLGGLASLVAFRRKQS